MKVEEQDDIDKLKIAMYGHKEDLQKQAEQSAHNHKMSVQTT